MRFYISQCRPAKKTAAPKGLRRSTKNSSSCPEEQQQQPEIVELIEDSSLASPRCLAVLPVPTSPVSCKAQKHIASDDQRGKAWHENKREPSRHSSLKLEVLIKKEPLRQTSSKLFALDETQPFRQTCFEPEETTAESELVKQNASNLEGFVEAGIDRHRSFKLEALVKPKVLSRTSSCTTIGRKRVVGVDELSQDLAFPNCSSLVFSEFEYSPRKRFASPRTPSSCLDRSPCASLTISDLEGSPRVSFPLPQTPSTLTSRLTFGPGSADDADCGGDSLLEEIPFDLLLRIVCCLQHDDLKPVSHVCKRLMKAVSIARLFHFSFTTPHREKKGKRSQLFLCNKEHCISKGGLAGTFVRPSTPNAPRQLSRPAEAKFSDFETCPCTSPLFHQEPPPLSLQSREPLRLSGMVSHRILFNEDELCQAVAQNTL